MFKSHLNLLNATFPLSPTPVPFPPSSFLPSCPNLSPSVGSCCNATSVNFTRAFISRFTSIRARLNSSVSALNTSSLYTALTNHTLPPGVVLTSAQQQNLSTVIRYIQSWAAQGGTCVDHWMAYISSLFCLACDPHHSTSPYYEANPFPGVPPRLFLQQSTCTSIFSQCAAVMLSFLEDLPPLISALEAFMHATPSYNSVNITSWYSTYAWPFDQARLSMEATYNIDICRYQLPHQPQRTDCQHFFCIGSQLWREPDPYSPMGDRVDTETAHAFRGMNYAQGVLTMDDFVNVNAYFAFIICVMREAFAAQAPWGWNDRHSDGCPRDANVIDLLFPGVWDMGSPVSSAALPLVLHGSPRESSDCRVDYLSSVFTYPSRANVHDSCNLNGYAGTVWVNTTEVGVAWPAYQVGCAMNLSKVICDVGDSPSLPVIPGLTWMLRVGFIVLVAGGLVGIGVVVGGLTWRCKRRRRERSRAQLSESLMGEQWGGWNAWPNGEEDTAAFLTSLNGLASPSLR